MRADYTTRYPPSRSAPEGGGRGPSLGGGVALAGQLPEWAGAFLWRDPGGWPVGGDGGPLSVRVSGLFISTIQLLSYRYICVYCIKIFLNVGVCNVLLALFPLKLRYAYLHWLIILLIDTSRRLTIVFVRWKFKRNWCWQLISLI